jgi:hypothetical protein
MLTSSKCVAALATVASIGVVGVVGVAAAAFDGPTQITVEPAASLTAGEKSPFDVAGVKAIRRGKAIPAGYVLPGLKVTIKRGKVAAGASLHFKCPDAKRLKSFATDGQAGFTSRQTYVNHHEAWVESFRTRDGSGIVYAVCR